MTRIALISVLAAALALPVAASAQTTPVPTPQTIEIYRGQVEPICNETNKARKKAGKRYKQDLKAGKFKQVGRRFVAAARVFRRGNAKIAAIARPPDSAAKISRWIKSRKGDASLLGRFGAVLENLTPASVQKALKLQEMVASHVLKTKRTSRGLGFRHCRL